MTADLTERTTLTIIISMDHRALIKPTARQKLKMVT